MRFERRRWRYRPILRIAADGTSVFDSTHPASHQSPNRPNLSNPNAHAQMHKSTNPKYPSAPRLQVEDFSQLFGCPEENLAIGGAGFSAYANTATPPVKVRPRQRANFLRVHARASVRAHTMCHPNHN